MTNDQQSFGRNMEALFEAGALGGLTDRQLLERFTAPESDAAELAFGVLVERHGPMVFHACRSILRDRHAAEDAFQATFLILSRKAGALGFRDSVGPWLFGAACRVAWCARKAALRRRTHEQKAADLARPHVDDPGWDDRDEVLYEELNRLPERYRVAVTVCDLEGLTQEQAARRLGWPPGTVRSRLARGRGRLRDRLTRRGLAPAVVPLGASLVRPVVPGSLAAATVENAVRLSTAGAVTGTLASAIAFTDGVMTIMFMSKLKLVLAAGLTSGILLGGTALVAHRAMGLPQGAPAEVKSPPQNQIETRREPTVPVQPVSETISPNAKAQLDVARKIRDNAYKMYRGGSLDELSYLSAQRRYEDLVGELSVKSDADRVRFQQVRVAGWKRFEQIVRKKHADGQIRENDMLAVELDRLGAEDDLAKAKARISLEMDVVKSRLEVAKKLRDVMYQRFKGGDISVMEYLPWQKRYYDVAYSVILLTGGDRVRLFEGQVAEMKRLEQVADERYRHGQVQQSDILIVQYYRLGAEEALARAKAEIGENSGTTIHEK